MGEAWTIPVLVFLAVLLGVPALNRLVFQTGRTRKSIHRRLTESKQSTSATEALDALRRERGFVDVKNPWLRGLNDLLMQTGLTLDRRLVLLSVVALALLLFLLRRGS